MLMIPFLILRIYSLSLFATTTDQLKIVSELNELEIHQKILMLNYQKLKTMVKRSIDQKFRLRNFDTGELKVEQWSRIEKE